MEETNMVYDMRNAKEIGDNLIGKYLEERYTESDHERKLNMNHENVILENKSYRYGTLLKEVDYDHFLASYEDAIDMMVLDLRRGEIVKDLSAKKPMNFTEAMERMLAEPVVMMGYISDDGHDGRHLYFKVDVENGHKNLMFCSFNPKTEKDVTWMSVMHILRDQDLSASVWFEVE